MEEFPAIIVVHAVSALYVLLLGPVQILRRRRDLAHRLLGATWVAAMLVVCLSSFFIVPDGVSWLHALSTWTLVCIVIAIVAVRRGAVVAHRRFMIGSYLGTLIAFAFAALVPTRLIPQLLRNEPLVVIMTVMVVAATVVVAVRLATRKAIRGQASSDFDAVDA